MPSNKANLTKICFIFFMLLNYANGTLSKSDRKSQKIDKKNIDMEHIHELNNDVKNSSLIKKNIRYQDIIKEHKSFSVTRAILRHFPNDVLGFVTPWNNHGYDIAKLFSSKFTIISPVWLQIKPFESNKGFLIQGQHDIDEHWILSLKQLNKKIKILPRLIFEQWTYPDLLEILQNKAKEVSSQLTKLAKEKVFDGYVVEIWSLLGGHLKKELTDFIVNLSSGLEKSNLKLILVIPPAFYSGSKVGMFLRQDFENLANHVAAFSLMSYDYSNYQRPGPNSPLTWLLQCVEELIPDKNNPNRKKLLLGLNFYGNDYTQENGKSIVGHEFISTLENYKPKFTFNNVTGEHSFTYRDGNSEHTVYYPTLYSVHLRLQLAKQLGLGIAIWEIGQGLDYFYDLL